MGKDRFERWLKNIYRTEEDEISCSVCFDLVSHFVELEFSGREPADQLPKVKQHLEQCAVCREEYEVLRDLRRLEEEGEKPSIDDLQNLIP